MLALSNYQELQEIVEIYNTVTGLLNTLLGWASSNETIALVLVLVAVYVVASIGWSVVKPIVNILSFTNPLRWLQLIFR